MTPEELDRAARAAADRVKMWWWMIAPMITGDYGAMQPTVEEVKIILGRMIDYLRQDGMKI